MAFQDEKILKGLDRQIKVYSVFIKIGVNPVQDSQKKVAKTSKFLLITNSVIIGLIITVFGIKQSNNFSKNFDSKTLAVFNFENLLSDNENDRTGQIL